MKNNADTTKEVAAKDPTPKAKAKRQTTPKTEKITKKSKPEADADAETGDRLPGNLEELKATKIVRRITGRVRLFQRVFELMAAR